MLVACSVLPSLCAKIVTVSVSDLHSERGLCGRESGHRHSIRRGADVVETGVVEEVNRCGVAAVLAADSDLQLGTRLASALDADAHEIAHALHVDRRERILFEDLLLLIDLQELP